MREGSAASKSSDDDEERSNVIPFPEQSVDYSGSAQKLMAGLAKAAVQLDRALKDRHRTRHRPEFQAMIQRVIETMNVIEEHMGVIETYSEALQSFMEPGDNVYFSSDATQIPLEVTSRIERRQATLMVQRLYFKGSASMLPGMLPKPKHDNDCETLLTHDGCVACKWPRSA